VSCSVSPLSLALMVMKSSMPPAPPSWPSVTAMPAFSACVPDGHRAGDRQGGGRNYNLVTDIALLVPHSYQTHVADTVSTSLWRAPRHLYHCPSPSLVVASLRDRGQPPPMDGGTHQDSDTGGEKRVANVGDYVDCGRGVVVCRATAASAYLSLIATFHAPGTMRTHL